MDASAFSSDLKDAFVALAGVAGVVWTGALVLKTAFRLPSSWGIMAAMDLLQCSFVASVLALAVSATMYRLVAVAFVVFYAIAYGATFLSFIPAVESWLVARGAAPDTQPDQNGARTRWLYVASAVLFFGFAVAIVIVPTREMAFAAAFVWFFVGMQGMLMAYHGAAAPPQ